MQSKSEDVLDRVMIAPLVLERWKAHCFARGNALRLAAFRPEEIADEEARLAADGALELFVRLPDGSEISMRIAAGEWVWRTGIS